MFSFAHDKRFIGIVGSRRRDSRADFIIVEEVFASVATAQTVIVSGGCSLGGDRFAEMIAARWNLSIVIHKPDKNSFLDTLQPYRATKQNYARNELIARDATFALIACVAPDRKGGTENTITRYRRIHGKEPIIV